MSDDDSQEEHVKKPQMLRQKPAFTKRQEAQIKKYILQSHTLNAAVANSTTSKRKSPEARAAASGNELALKRSIYNIIWNKVSAEQRERIAELVCNEWNYCDNRTNINEIVSVIYFVTLIVQPIAVPICVWVFVMKYRMFDELCGCENRDLPVDLSRWWKKKGRK